MDQLHKLQAKSAAHKRGGNSSGPAYPDDLLSESTTTLQGSTTQDSGRQSALPALLPDEILNAAPVARLPTPPPPPPPPSYQLPADSGIKKPNKLRFLDRAEKPPKDISAGGTTIRVLHDNNSPQQGKSKPPLAPKASKASRNSRNNWFKRDRCTAHVNGMRRAAGGPSGFVRR